MKRLDFTGEDSTVRFEVIYDGFITTPRGFAAPTETRVVGRILDKMETIAHSDKRGPLATFSLNNGGGIVLLEEAEYNLLKESLESAKWTAGGARKATEVLDWLHAAPAHLEVAKDDAAK